MTSSIPPELSGGSAIDASWDTLAGQSGRKAMLARQREKEEVMLAARGLMLVCKVWKPVVLKYLYCEPALSSESLLGLTDAVLRGDRKWDDTRLHPHSIPGRYITTLDLSSLSEGYFGPHITALSRACGELAAVLPNLTHLKLPLVSAQAIFPQRCLVDAPFVSGLLALEGAQQAPIVPVPGAGANMFPDGPGTIYGWIGMMRSLRFLAASGPGMPQVLPTASPLDSVLSGKRYDLPHLHTLSLDGIHSGVILQTLINSELPNLTRAAITSYNAMPDDETTRFIQVHGHKLVSLTFLPTRDWPAVHPCPPVELLELCPSLRHLSLSMPNTALQQHRDLALWLTKYKSHPLEAITIPKWISDVSRTSPSPSPSLSPLAPPPPHSLGNGQSEGRYHCDPPRGNPFLTIILRNPPPNLRIITVDGFAWVSPKLPRAARDAGPGAEMRVWSTYLEARGIELRDGDGHVMPDYSAGLEAGVAGLAMGGMGERGRRRGSKPFGIPERAREEDEDGG